LRIRSVFAQPSSVDGLSRRAVNELGRAVELGNGVALLRPRPSLVFTRRF